MKPLCFILMPFGKKQSGEMLIDFDQIYNSMIKPAIIKAGMEPIRADEERTDGIIHKAMFERLILCEYAVADLTAANANVFYELGVRHAIKPFSTVLLFANSTRLPFDVTFLRALSYDINSDGTIADVDQHINHLTQKLLDTRTNKATDSPLFQLLDDYPNISHEKTDIFRELVQYSVNMKEELAEIRIRDLTPEQKLIILQQFEENLGNLGEIESGVIIDLFLSYRAFDGYEKMVSLVKKMPQPLASTVLVREQFGFALNRLKKRKEAEVVLSTLIDERGPSSETLGILGRVYKDQWEEAEKSNNELMARGLLRKCIETYKKGFDTDWRDAYPGVNAATFLFIQDPDQPGLKELLPVVRYAVTNKIKIHGGNYWDNATLFELDILEKKAESAQKNLELAAGLLTEGWQAKTTLNNLQMIRKAREKRGDDVHWLLDFEKQLAKLC